MPTVSLDTLIYDTTIYPREKWHAATVQEYAEALQKGAIFPPLILEEGTTRIFDGVHRWKAYLKYRETYEERFKGTLIEHEYDRKEDWAVPLTEIPVEYHTLPEHMPAKLYSMSLGRTHGDRISHGEVSAYARELFKENPDFSMEVFCEAVGIPQSSAYRMVQDLLALRKMQKRTVAWRLNALGWTQEEIADGVDIAQSSIRSYLQEFPSADIQKQLKQGLTCLQVAEAFHIPMILAHAIDLEGQADQERMKRLGITLQPYDVWSFTRCDDLYGNEWPGRIPGQLVAHAVYFFTEPGEVVLDPMSGSGTTQDICLAMGRKNYGYDLTLEHERPDILVHDLKVGWPDRIKKAGLIFWDPPYFNKKDNLYTDGSISSLERADYLNFFKDRFAEAYADVKKGTRLAFLMSDWDDAEGDCPMIGRWHYAYLMEDAGWTITRSIDCPLSTQLVHPDIVEKFRKSRRLARLNRSLLVAEKR